MPSARMRIAIVHFLAKAAHAFNAPKALIPKGKIDDFPSCDTVATRGVSLCRPSGRGAVENIVDKLRRSRIRPFLKDFAQRIEGIDRRIVEDHFHQKASRLSHRGRGTNSKNLHDRVSIQSESFRNQWWVLTQDAMNALRKLLERRQLFSKAALATADVGFGELEQLLQ